MGASAQPQLGGFKFRRQSPMGNGIADFYCAECKPVVEIDGDIHDFQVEEDAARAKQIESFGYGVIRFRNEEVLHDIETVLAKILEACVNSPFSQNWERVGVGARPFSQNGARGRGEGARMVE